MTVPTPLVPAAPRPSKPGPARRPLLQNRGREAVLISLRRTESEFGAESGLVSAFAGYSPPYSPPPSPVAITSYLFPQCSAHYLAAADASVNDGGGGEGGWGEGTPLRSVLIASSRKIGTITTLNEHG